MLPPVSDGAFHWMRTVLLAKSNVVVGLPSPEGGLSKTAVPPGALVTLPKSYVAVT